MVKAVFFDAGHTLINVYERRRFELLKYFCDKCSKQKLADADWKKGSIFAELHYQRSHQQPGYVETKGFWVDHYTQSLITAGIENQLADQVVKEIMEKRHTINKSFWLESGCMGVLKILKEQNIKVAMVSNWDGTLVKVCKDLGIDDYFDFIADSHVIGSCKPEAEIFKYTLDKLDVSPNDVIHVGDLYYTDIVGSLNVGIKPVLYDPNKILSQDYQCSSISNLSEIIEIVGDINT